MNPSILASGLRFRSGPMAPRLRHAERETLSLEQMYLLPGLAGMLRTEMRSVHRTLLSQFGRFASPTSPSRSPACRPQRGELLGQSAGTPVLKLERKGYDQHRRAFEYSVDLFRADRTRLHVRTQSPVTVQPM